MWYVCAFGVCICYVLCTCGICVCVLRRRVHMYMCICVMFKAHGCVWIGGRCVGACVCWVCVCVRGVHSDRVAGSVVYMYVL